MTISGQISATTGDSSKRNREAVDVAIRGAHHVTTLELTNNRLAPNAMEPRVAIGDYNPATDESTLYTTSQNPHVIRLLMGAFVLGLPEHKLRVVAPDVGGGFGSKIFHYAEEALCTFAARQLKRAVKWTASRSESFITDAHGRDHVTRIDLALDQDGNFLAIRTATLRQHGCIPVDVLDFGSDLAARDAHGRQLQDSVDIREREGGVHQHGSG